ncbi:MAG: nucleotidyltransferase family protein [Oscillospiraceae bacterium]|nr:nucleotidyltransferase family protein [Oscillospiraceae bacterium]
MLLGYNCDLTTQTELLFSIISKSPALFSVFEGAQELGLGEYYIGGGCLCQTVWNYQNGFDPLHGVSDIDLAYFDADTSADKEDRTAQTVREHFPKLTLRIDIKNQARVHLWYKRSFGYEIQPYRSLEDAVSTWPTTASAVGARMEAEQLIVCAPFGLNDLFGQTVRANKTQITPEIYRKKCEKWCAQWSTLRVIPW